MAWVPRARARPSRRAAYSQVRGVGNARPRPAASLGMTLSWDSRVRRNPATSALSLVELVETRSSPVVEQRAPASVVETLSNTGIAGHTPVTIDSAYTSSGMPQSRWTNRDAVGEASSQPAAATSAGLAAATKETVSGSCSDPTS